MAPLSVKLGIEEFHCSSNWLIADLYSEFRNVKSACLSLGPSSRKRFLTCSASPP
jgi:hypothetical protein